MAPPTTLPTSAACSSRRVDARRGFHGRGFTLVELLVVIGIIVLIIGLASPMITRAWRAGDRAATYADLQAIAAGLEAYRQDHGDYPRITETPLWAKDFRGARLLCRALIGPGPATGAAALIGDGADGPGFRIRGTQGKIYGPYIQVDKFKFGNPSGTQTQPGYLAILDRYGKPILYYPALGKPNISVKDGFIKDYDPAKPPTDVRPLYNAGDNIGSATFPGMVPAVFQKMMGDMNANGMIDGGETAAYEGPFILWSAGLDEKFGPSGSEAAPRSTTPGPEDYPLCDDITNFRK